MKKQNRQQYTVRIYIACWLRSHKQAFAGATSKILNAAGADPTTAECTSWSSCNHEAVCMYLPASPNSVLRFSI